MKLLGWVHRKFRQNSGEAFKELAMGLPPVEEHQHLSKPSIASRSSRSSKDNLYGRSLGVSIFEQEDDDLYLEHSAVLSELFRGFLSIGTLGSDHADQDAPTSVPIPFSNNLSEKKMEETDDDIRLIKEEIEKVIAVESKKETSDENTSTNVANASLSQRVPSESPVDILGNTLMSVVTKKEHRPSLGELLLRSKMTHENFRVSGICEKEEKREGDKSLVKKMLKRRTTNTVHGSTRNNSADSVSTETKLQKILQIFNRKVHPDCYETSTKKSVKREKPESKSAMFIEDGDENEDNQDTIIIPGKPFRKESIRRCKCNSNQHSLTQGGREMNGGKEYWIRTDADYLVLEL